MESLGKAAVFFVNGGKADYDAVELLDSGVLKALDKVVKPGRLPVLVDQSTGTEYKVVYYSQALWTSVQPVSTIKIDETPCQWLIAASAGAVAVRRQSAPPATTAENGCCPI